MGGAAGGGGGVLVAFDTRAMAAGAADTTAGVIEIGAGAGDPPADLLPTPAA